MRSNNPCVRSKAIGTFIVILGCVLSAQGRAQEAGKPTAQTTGGAQFEPASVAAAAGSNCILHPEGNQDPKETLHVNADEDGVVRFLAVRPTTPNSVEKLVLECTDANKQAKTYSVDLRSEETFKPRPFDPTHTTLRVRPPLTGDPSRFTQQDLLKAGYGPRPDATVTPDAYKQWLAAAMVPMHVLRTDKSLTPLPISRHPDLKRTERVPLKKGRNVVQKAPSTLANGGGGWTGPILEGSFKKGATAAETTSYVMIAASFYVPKIMPGPTAAASIWAGLDNVFQAVVWVSQTPTIATFSIHRQDFSRHGKENDEAGTRFTPETGDLIEINLFYCDSAGNLKVGGGYACSAMADQTKGEVWVCYQPDSSDCPSYKLDPQDLGNGKLGQQAEFIIENDTGEAVSGSEQWPILSPMVMTGWAYTAKGTGQDWKTVGVKTDPLVVLNTDGYNSKRHLDITLSSYSTRWGETECSANEKWDANKGECVPKN